MRDVIEIAEVMEDTVLAVNHLAVPQRKGRSWPILAAAALGFTAFFGAGAFAVSVAAENQSNLKAFVDKGNAPIDFHPRRLSPFADVTAIFGLGSGLAFATWALWRRRDERRASTFRAPDGTVIIEHRGDAWCFEPSPGMSGAPARLDRSTKVRATLGPVSYLIAQVPPPRAHEGVGATLDRRALVYAGASTAAHAVLVILFFLLPATARGFFEDDPGANRRRAVVRFTATEDAKKERPPETGKNGLGGEPKASAAELGKPGQMGKEDSKNETGRAKVKRVKDEQSIARPEESSVHDISHSGALGVMNAHRDALTAITSLSNVTSGMEDEDIRGGYLGDQARDARGGWGTAPYGRGPGGGGHLAGTIGTGDYKIPYSVTRVGGPNLTTRRPDPKFVIGPVDAPEGVDKNMIRRYVRSKTSEITWCYQKELTVRPALSGTVTTSFTIDENGRVIRAHAGGFGVPAIESCLEGVLRSIAFPRGQIVNVTAYPFTFHPVGG